MSGIYSDDLVDFKLRAGVRYLSFSIDTAPECILSFFLSLYTARPSCVVVWCDVVWYIVLVGWGVRKIPR